MTLDVHSQQPQHKIKIKNILPGFGLDLCAVQKVSSFCYFLFALLAVRPRTFVIPHLDVNEITCQELVEKARRHVLLIKSSPRMAL